MVKSPSSKAEDAGSIPGQGVIIRSHKLWGNKTRVPQQREACGHFSEDLMQPNKERKIYFFTLNKECEVKSESVCRSVESDPLQPHGL